MNRTAGRTWIARHVLTGLPNFITLLALGSFLVFRSAKERALSRSER